MQQGRLFTFGCSLTRYQYPTWADILGKEWEYYENWGKPGSGNLYILNSLIECLHRNNLSSDDYVMIMWTGLSRIDYYQFGTWRSLVNNFPNESGHLAVNCPDGYEIVNYPLMYAAHKILDENNIPYKSMTWTNYFNNSPVGILYNDTLNKIFKIKFNFNRINYKPLPTLYYSERLKNLYTTMAGKDWPSLGTIVDGSYVCANSEIEAEILNFIKIYSHDKDVQMVLNQTVDTHPRPSQHLEAVNCYFSEVKISDATQQWVQEIDEKIISGKSFDFIPNLPATRL